MDTTTQLTEQIKELIRINISSEDFRNVKGDFGMLNGKYQYIIDWDNLHQRDIDVCTENLKIIQSRIDARMKRDYISTGDYLEMPDKSISRITHCWDDSVQDGGGSGSFYLNSNGGASYSGSLDRSKPKDLITLTPRTKRALFWIFSRDRQGAGRGFYFYVDVKVWEIKNLMKNVQVKFKDHTLNYHTSVNGKIQDYEIKHYFVGKWFNLGTDGDNMQQCTDCSIYY